MFLSPNLKSLHSGLALVCSQKLAHYASILQLPIMPKIMLAFWPHVYSYGIYNFTAHVAVRVSVSLSPNSVIVLLLAVIVLLLAVIVV